MLHHSFYKGLAFVVALGVINALSLLAHYAGLGADAQNIGLGLAIYGPVEIFVILYLIKIGWEDYWWTFWIFIYLIFNTACIGIGIMGRFHFDGAEEATYLMVAALTILGAFYLNKRYRDSRQTKKEKV